MAMNTLLQSGEFYAASCATLWAVAVILFRIIGQQTPPVVLNLFKNTVGLVLLTVSMLVVGAPFFPEDQGYHSWVILLLSGAIGIAVADSLFFACLNRLGAGGSAIVDCLYSPFVILCAFFYLGESLKPALVLAALLVVGAILIGTWNPQQKSTTTERRQTHIGILMGAASMLTMAIGIVMAKPILEEANTWWATEVRLLGAMPLLVLQGAGKRYRRQVVATFTPGSHWKMLLPTSVIATYFALLLWIMGFKYAQAGTASVLNQTSNIMVLILATVVLKEALTWRRGVAIVMGFAGAVIVVL